jgi:energy-coupling factor transport system substrate-specific component
MNTQKNSNQERMLMLAFIPLAIAINVALGAIVKALNMPLYVDSIGTILTTILLGWKRGAIVGVLGFVITSIFINPFAVYFSLTQVAIALFVGFVGKKGWFKNAFRTIGSGAVLGIITALVSAPVIVFVFQGATGNGAALVTSFFAKMGNQIVNSIFLAGFSIEPLDKVIQCLLAYFILKSIPKNLLGKFKSGCLKENNFIA